MHRTYLDHAAATPTVPSARRAYRQAELIFGNPSSLHTEGRAARTLLESSRTSIARILSVKPEGIIFTSGATEANTLALLGYVDALKHRGTSYADMEVLVLGTEHSSILTCIEALSARGVSAKTAPVKSDGRIDLDVFQKLLSSRTVLVSAALVNGEIGVIQPLRKMRALMKLHAPNALLHSDAAQAPRTLSVRLSTYGIDLMTLDALKIGGGRGVGALVCGRHISLHPLQKGSQEQGMRGGTQNVAGVASFAAALHDAEVYRSVRIKEWQALKSYFIERVTKEFPDALINGSVEHAVPSIVNISCLEHDTEYLSVILDTRGIAVSTTSACDADKGISHVVEALGGGDVRARRALRISFGPETKKSHLERLVLESTRGYALTKV